MKQQPEETRNGNPSQSLNSDETMSPVNGNSSIIEFLNQEQKCLNPIDNDSELDIESIFEEINRLSDESDERSLDEILREAELLLCEQKQIGSDLKNNENDLMASSGVENGGGDDGGSDNRGDNEITDITISISNELSDDIDSYDICHLNKHLDTISEKSTPRNTKSTSSDSRDELAMQTNIDLELDQQKERCRSARKSSSSSSSAKSVIPKLKPKRSQEYLSVDESAEAKNDILIDCQEIPTEPQSVYNVMNSPQRILELDNDIERVKHDKTGFVSDVKASPMKNVVQQQIETETEIETTMLPILSKPRSSRSPSVATITSPTTPIASIMSASSSFSWTRERALEQQIDNLKETLKDTEERLHSLRLQYDNISQMHRSLRDTNHQMTEEMDRLKIDIQHLRDCANILRTELQAARKDRAEAQELQATLQRELDTLRNEKKRACDEVDSNARQILDLQRQCREMERILARKNPDAIQSLLGSGSKKAMEEKMKIEAGRRQLEQRIAQLENDAREQDRKAQLILANVQSRFSSVQSKYETHISDLETQVLSLQQINQILNEKIESQSRLKSPNNNYMIDQQSCGIQTDPSNERTSNHLINTQTQTDLKSPVSTPSASKPAAKKTPKTAVQASKEETHLLSTIRGMRVDLAIKEKSLQRLTRELDDCKKTIRKLQKDNESARNEKPSKKPYDPTQFSEANGNSKASELQEKVKLLEMDYKTLHDKRLQDLKTLQSAHERELSANKETVRLLEQRLAERDEAFAIIQKHNKIPIDYFALKAKVSSLERRNTEREQRLHILVEALSKGRLSGLNE